MCLEATQEQNRDPHTTLHFCGAQNPSPTQGTIMITPLIVLGPKYLHRKNTSFSRRGVYGPGPRPRTSSICRWNLRSHNMQQSQTSNSCELFPFCQNTQALLLLPALRWRASVQRILCSDASLRQTRFGSFLLKIARTPRSLLNRPYASELAAIHRGRRETHHASPDHRLSAVSHTETDSDGVRT